MIIWGFISYGTTYVEVRALYERTLSLTHAFETYLGVEVSASVSEATLAFGEHVAATPRMVIGFFTSFVVWAAAILILRTYWFAVRHRFRLIHFRWTWFIFVTFIIVIILIFR